MPVFAKILIVFGLILLINVPFGYWRSRTRRFSWQWILAIHVPVPIAIGLRLLILGWMWILLPVFVAAYSLGQFAGGKIRQRIERQKARLSTNLAGDSSA